MERWSIKNGVERSIDTLRHKLRSNMNRELKFRAWSPKLKFMVYSETKRLGQFFDHDIGDNWPVMQFTGLKTSTGKEIYEGDILSVPQWKSKGRTEIVVKIGYFNASDDAGVNTFGFRAYDEYGEPEVIGNIYSDGILLGKVSEMFPDGDGGIDGEAEQVGLENLEEEWHGKGYCIEQDERGLVAYPKDR